MQLAACWFLNPGNADLSRDLEALGARKACSSAEHTTNKNVSLAVPCGEKVFS
jgi:hypothetical protein